jgi:mono/diheme cytochrome c family protein
MRLRHIPPSLAVFLAAAFIASPRQEGKTVWNGVYAETQAAQGRARYEESCGRCHGGDLAGGVGTSLKGDVFIRDWAGKNLGAFYERITTTMPAWRTAKSE